MKKQGFDCVCGRIDDGGKLAKSEEFLTLMQDEMHIAMQTTGGDNSNSNGMAESPQRSIKTMTPALLITAALPDLFWCFAMQYAVFILNNTYHSL